jgi:serine/threonine protein kinase
MYRHLGTDKFVPKVYYYGESAGFHIMIMEMLGESLEKLFTRCDRKFSLKTVIMLGIQMLHRIEHHHKCHFLHRDIKPDNFLMGNLNIPTLLTLVVDYLESRMLLQRK